MSGISRLTKDALVSVLGGITYNGETAFSAVLDSTTDENKYDQLALVLPGNITNQVETTDSTLRVLAYVVRVKVTLEQTLTGEADAYNRMYDLTDLIINALDDADAASTIEQSVPALATSGQIMRADRGDWFVVESNNGVSLFCDLNVTITYSRNVA